MQSSSALAGGFFLYEVGTPDVGLASAGYAASNLLPIRLPPCEAVLLQVQLERAEILGVSRG